MSQTASSVKTKKYMQKLIKRVKVYNAKTLLQLEKLRYDHACMFDRNIAHQPTNEMGKKVKFCSACHRIFFGGGRIWHISKQITLFVK